MNKKQMKNMNKKGKVKRRAEEGREIQRRTGERRTFVELLKSRKRGVECRRGEGEEIADRWIDRQIHR